MAKINVMGDAVVVTSAVKFEDLRTVEKYRPEALLVKGGEDGKDVVFTVSTHGEGCISKYGVTFSGESREGEKLACLTLNVQCDTDDLSDFITDKLGAAIIQLNKLEKTLPAVIEEIKAEAQAVKNCITIA